MIRVLFVFGTRPEAIKMAPVIRELGRSSEFQTRVCVTAQHREMLDRVLEIFDIRPEYDLDLMLPGQTLFQSTARIVSGLEAVFTAEKPDLTLVQGDTTTTFCGALAAFYAGTAIGHIEAGLRTGDLRQPFPEELNRVLAAQMTDLHFAATASAAANLRAAGVDENRIFVTGNTGIDAVLYVCELLDRGVVRARAPIADLPPGCKLIVVTAHRRESFGPGMERICHALVNLAARPDVQIVYAVHPNPNVQEVVNRWLRNRPRVQLLEPLDYVSFVDLMRRAYLLITDSGGVQEEGPSLGKPILVLRDKTERPEAVEAGTVRLVGTDTDRIVNQAEALLDDADAHKAMARKHNPYGDGRAAERIRDALLNWARTR